jgi:hypothetical protein
MSNFFKMPAVKIWGAFLAGMLVVAVLSLLSACTGGAGPLGNENSARAAGNAVTGLGPDTIPDMVSKAVRCG